MKLFRLAGDPDKLAFECPGCQCSHYVAIAGPVKWTWNGSMERPTFHPSVRIPIAGHGCHSWIKDGKIQFLADCDHALAGQTVELPEVASQIWA
jgi:uncharacterized protein DUF6527